MRRTDIMLSIFSCIRIKSRWFGENFSMTKRCQRKHRMSRRLGVNLWGGSSPVEKKNFPPGIHGTKGYPKASDYGVQLKAKQKLRFYYGNITEKQFRKIYKEALRSKGNTENNLVGLLESRLDAIVYRAGFVPTVFAARQLVSHYHVLVDGHPVNIPSYTVKPGSVVTVKESSRSMPMVAESVLVSEGKEPDYLEVSGTECAAKFVRRPEFSEVPYPVEMEPRLVIEFYSR